MKRVFKRISEGLGETRRGASCAGRGVRAMGAVAEKLGGTRGVRELRKERVVRFGGGEIWWWWDWVVVELGGGGIGWLGELIY